MATLNNEFPKIEKEILANAENPEWLAWEEIQKKYPKKWVMLGYKDKGTMNNTTAHILGVADSFDGINDYYSKYKPFFSKTRLYTEGFSTRITTLTKRKKRMIVSLKAVVIQ